MKEIETDKVKKFGYRCGQLLAIVMVSCAIALMLCGTYAILRLIF